MLRVEPFRETRCPQRRAKLQIFQSEKLQGNNFDLNCCYHEVFPLIATQLLPFFPPHRQTAARKTAFKFHRIHFDHTPIEFRKCAPVDG